MWICSEGLDGGPELERTIRGAGFRVAVAPTTQRLASGDEIDGPAVVVLSDAVPGWQRIVREVRQSRLLVRVLLISDLDDRLELVSALSAGVDGIGRHDDAPEAVVGAVVGLCEHGASVPRSLTKYLVGEVRAGRGRSVRMARGDVRVTDREWQILQLVLQGMTTNEMAAELFIANGTVRSHVSVLLRKLGVGSRSEAVALIERRDGPPELAPSPTR